MGPPRKEFRSSKIETIVRADLPLNQHFSECGFGAFLQDAFGAVVGCLDGYQMVWGGQGITQLEIETF